MKVFNFVKIVLVIIMETKEKTFESLNSFWQDHLGESIKTEDSLLSINNSELAVGEELTIESFGDQWLKIIKGLFLYLPGVTFLFPCSLFLINTFFTGQSNFLRVSLGMLWLFLFGFMVMFGIGDVKNPKYLALPISVVAFSLFIFLVSSLFGSEMSWNFLANYSIYLFPIAFMLPVVVKELLED